MKGQYTFATNRVTKTRAGCSLRYETVNGTWYVAADLRHLPSGRWYISGDLWKLNPKADYTDGYKRFTAWRLDGTPGNGSVIECQLDGDKIPRYVRKIIVALANQLSNKRNQMVEDERRREIEQQKTTR